MSDETASPVIHQFFTIILTTFVSKFEQKFHRWNGETFSPVHLWRIPHPVTDLTKGAEPRSAPIIYMKQHDVERSEAAQSVQCRAVESHILGWCPPEQGCWILKTIRYEMWKIKISSEWFRNFKKNWVLVVYYPKLGMLSAKGYKPNYQADSLVAVPW